jgi:hypothetical protein
MQQPLKPRMYGLDRCIRELEHYLCLHTGYASVYFGTPRYSRKRLHYHLRRIIRTHLLGPEFHQAVAHDLLDGTIRTESPLFQYLKNRWYRGDTRALLGDLRDALCGTAGEDVRVQARPVSVGLSGDGSTSA